MESERAEVKASREAVYAPDKEAERIGAEAVGSAIRGILMAHWQMDLPPMPAHVVMHIYVAMKTIRAALPFKYNDDNYIDAHNYLDMGRRQDQRSPENQIRNFNVEEDHRQTIVSHPVAHGDNLQPVAAIPDERTRTNAHGSSGGDHARTGGTGGEEMAGEKPHDEDHRD